MSAQVSFLEGTLSLIHIPLDLYSTFLQPILKVLLPPSRTQSQSTTTEQPNGSAIDNSSRRRRSHRHGFLNVSVTPIECSIVCDSAWARSVFEPAIGRLPGDVSEQVVLSDDTYAALCVTSAGMDAGSRVADLTSPLALAGIPIFFITTYYSDFILVPTKARQAVVRTLLARGFFFSSEDESSLVSPSPNPSPMKASSRGYGYGHGHSMGGQSQRSSSSSELSISSSPPSPSAPPQEQLSSVGELQERTFDLLRERNVFPYVDPELRLVQCSGRGDSAVRGGYSERPSLLRSRGSNGAKGARGGAATTTCWVDTVDTKLYTSVVAALVSQPRFLSVTLAQGDPPSLLLDRSLLGMFGDSLVGPTEGALVPIFLDLADLPFEATGIVSGVAGRLVREMRMAESAELSYLSTARAGAVILSQEQSVKALEVLRPLLTAE
ncbi:hypothetical protein VTK56DRAFT_1341 [Thermocarpiscus australiensis]